MPPTVMPELAYMAAETTPQPPVMMMPVPTASAMQRCTSVGGWLGVVAASQRAGCSVAMDTPATAAALGACRNSVRNMSDTARHRARAGWV